MKTRRGPGSDKRGSSYDRRARRRRMVEKHGIPRKRDGRKTRIPCFHCGRAMRADGPWHVDRYPVCGHRKGRYVDSNVVPSCARCNEGRCRDGACCGRRKG